MFSDQSFLRYNRQIRLPEIGELGQSHLNQASILIIGAGGLGSAASLYLAGAGIGTIVIADEDVIETSNLQRQIIYRDHHQGQSKAQTAVTEIKAFNPLIRARAVKARLAGNQLAIEISMADLVLDCSDNFATRYAVNQACFRAKKPLLSGAAIRWQGQLMAFDFQQNNSPCYQCLFPEVSSVQDNENCSQSGISGPVVGVIGTLQALESIKFFTNPDTVQFGQFCQFEGLTMNWQRFNISRDANCPVCSNRTGSQEPSSQGTYLQGTK